MAGGSKGGAAGAFSIICAILPVLPPVYPLPFPPLLPLPLEELVFLTFAGGGSILTGLIGYGCPAKLEAI